MTAARAKLIRRLRAEADVWDGSHPHTGPLLSGLLREAAAMLEADAPQVAGPELTDAECDAIIAAEGDCWDGWPANFNAIQRGLMRDTMRLGWRAARASSGRTVPRQPTTAMIERGAAVYKYWMGNTFYEDVASTIYKAMWDASPAGREEPK